MPPLELVSSPGKLKEGGHADITQPPSGQIPTQHLPEFQTRLYKRTNVGNYDIWAPLKLRSA